MTLGFLQIPNDRVAVASYHYFRKAKLVQNDRLFSLTHCAHNWETKVT